MERIQERRTQDQVFVRGSASIPLLSHVANAADSLLSLQNALQSGFQWWIVDEVENTNGDAYQIFRTLLEMIKNAHDALVDRYPDGGPNGGIEEVRINYRIDHIRRRIHVIVADHGAGIHAVGRSEKEQRQDRYYGSFGMGEGYARRHVRGGRYRRFSSENWSVAIASLPFRTP